jgi:hypothetical protein
MMPDRASIGVTRPDFGQTLVRLIGFNPVQSLPIVDSGLDLPPDPIARHRFSGRLLMMPDRASIGVTRPDYHGAKARPQRR